MKILIRVEPWEKLSPLDEHLGAGVFIIFIKNEEEKICQKLILHYQMVRLDNTKVE